MLLQEISGDVRANVSGSTRQEYCHVAPFVPVFIASPSSVFVVVADRIADTCGMSSNRGARASNGRPSISGYVQRRNAGM
jgi:hypothetical protein